MTSNRQRRVEIQRKRRQQALTLAEKLEAAGGDDALRATLMKQALERGQIVRSDQAVLAQHNATAIELLPGYYVDRPETCTVCGASYVWTAEQQKWWYEVARGAIYSQAAGCDDCRRLRRKNRANDPNRQNTSALRGLADAPPDASARAKVDDALQSKWHGMRVVAIGVLGAWWGRQRNAADLARLKNMVTCAESSKRDRERALLAQAAVKAIAANMSASDMAWVLPELLLGDSAPVDGLRRMVEAMPQEALMQALAEVHWLEAMRTDRRLAPRLLNVLACADARTNGWPDLADHYMRSPLVGHEAQQCLAWRLNAVSDRNRSFQ